MIQQTGARTKFTLTYLWISWKVLLLLCMVNRTTTANIYLFVWSKHCLAVEIEAWISVINLLTEEPLSHT